MFFPALLTNPATASRVLCDTPNGHGGTNTKIRRFTNASTIGGDITYADSSANGATFTINTKGTYFFSYVDSNSGASCQVGASINSTQLTTNIQLITTANRIMAANAASNLHQGVSGIFRALPGDVVRAHTDGGCNSTQAYAQFQIWRIG